jgi:hypothetical protein
MLSDPERQAFERLVASLDEEGVGEEELRKSVAFGWLTLAGFLILIAGAVFLTQINPVLGALAWTGSVGLGVWAAPRFRAGYANEMWERLAESVHRAGRRQIERHRRRTEGDTG